MKTEIKKKKPVAKKKVAKKPAAKKKSAALTDEYTATKQKRNPGKKDMFGKPYAKGRRKSSIPDSDILPHQQMGQLIMRGEMLVAENLMDRHKDSLKKKGRKGKVKTRCSGKRC